MFDAEQARGEWHQQELNRKAKRKHTAENAGLNDIINKLDSGNYSFPAEGIVLLQADLTGISDKSFFLPEVQEEIMESFYKRKFKIVKIETALFPKIMLSFTY